MKVVSTVKTIEEALSLKYYIDFYQREYSWDKDNIESLLEDIYYRFDLSYDVNEEITKDFIKLNYKWYYINTYTVNTIQDRCCLVDGQQRLTTLTLFLIKLYHLANKFSLNNHRISYIQKSICQPHGNGYSFWLGDQNREATLNTLFQNDIVSQNEVSSEYFDESNKTLIVNYLLISKYFNHKFPFDEDDEDKMDSTRSKLEAYIFYLLNNVNLVEINVTDSDDVAMVFEVINAKGQKLKPFEIIKAKLLSKIRKEEIDTYLSLWNDCINNLHKNGLNVDDFFISLLKARYTTTINDLKTGITKDYHKEIFKLKDILDLSKERNVKDFISNVLKNYIKIYVEINSCSSDNTDYPAIYFNTLNKLNNQVLYST